MALTNYTDLKATIADYLARSDLTAQIPDFIQLTEAKLQRKFKGVTSLSSINPTNWLLTADPDVYLYGALLEAQPYLQDDARIATWAQIFEKVLSDIRVPDTASNFTNYTGLQAAIADWLERPDLANEIPNFIKVAETKFAIKFKNFTGLSVGSPTNSILTTYPDLYLYASLVEAATYLQDTVNLPFLQAELASRMSLVRVPDTTSSFASYTGFTAMVADWLNRPDLTNAIPTFITMAQERLSQDIRVKEMLKVATTEATGSSVELPSDFLEMRELHFQGNPPTTLSYQTPDQFFRNLTTTTSGIPHYYTLLNNEFQFAPTPNGTTTLQMLYYAKPVFISNSVASNIFLTKFPNALLYSTLVMAQPYLKEDDRLQTWAMLYQSEISSIMKNDLGKKYPNTSLNVTIH